MFRFKNLIVGSLLLATRGNGFFQIEAAIEQQLFEGHVYVYVIVFPRKVRDLRKQQGIHFLSSLL